MVFGKFAIQHADLIFSLTEQLIRVGPYFYMALHAGHLLFMASDTVIFYNIQPGLFNKYHLWLGAQAEDGCMSQAVFCLEEILVKNIVMRDMAIVAISFSPVRAVAPCRILWRHDMAIHAGGRIIRQIRPGAGSPEGENGHPGKYAQEDDHS